MSKNKNKGNLHLIGLGGAGINASVYVYEKMKELAGDGFSNVDIRLADTTTKSIQTHPDFLDKFSKITSNSATSELDGSGGERKSKEILKDIVIGMKEYLDFLNLSNNKNDYYVLFASASGGSGGSMLSVLLNLMLERNFSVMVAPIGDSSNFLYLNNTINVVSGLQNIALKSKNAVPVMYYDNTVDGQTTKATETLVNEKLFKMISIISVYIGGSILDIDNEDMRMFLNPSNYKTFNVKPGLYSLGISTRILDDENTILARTIVSKDETDEFKVTNKILHNKVGVIPEHMKDVFETYALFLILRKNIINEEIKKLKVELVNLEDLETTDYEEFETIENSEEDDFGLIV